MNNEAIAVAVRDKKVGARFWSKVCKATNTTGCWLWTGAISKTGYACISVNGRLVEAHRVSFLLHGRVITPGLVLDHICRVRHCVNPDHLRAVTFRENVLSGIGPTAVNARKTKCPLGHPYSRQNTYLDQGRRRCRACLHEKRVQPEAKERHRISSLKYAQKPDVKERVRLYRQSPLVRDRAREYHREYMRRRRKSAEKTADE